ncbi:DnaB-like helicase N-terminal domain-containing protein [uncultured Nostoc sp.]|uniref:DnaB-like helicase N-terminal domain-containing protein n=1 Tax=uncultured Nostoc sp. TaxID=340711 RepID=UPI0035C955F2
MTQGIYPFPQERVNFTDNSGKLPPCNIEAEETILGGILLDPEAIYRIKDRLKPEHFYISAHRDIYQACLRLSNKSKETDLLSVTSWLNDHGILAKIGGRNKLASLVTASAVNIDYLAALVIEKAILRDVIRTGNEISTLGYSTEVGLPEIISSLTEKFKSIIDTPSFQTKEENLRSQHSRLLNDLYSIYTTCVEPSFRFFRLHHLANESKVSINFLERFYLKSLTDQCSKLLTYEELKELAGSTVREWLLNGLVPKSTTILLASDGGVGKTKLAYGIGKILIQGSKFGPFQSTGEKRRILYYQGDESEGDMLQALETLGYSESDISKYVRVRFGWSTENMPTLIQDLKEFQPELVFIDSLSTANRFSIYRESEMEYARPILEMTGLANQYKVTFVIVHHTNKEGGVRGTTAIRNAVSEVWTLSKDNSQTATAYDRILEINKSRSRSSGKKYRLMFNSEDLSFTFLGEEGDELGGPGQSAKESTLELLSSHRNIKFTSEEIAHRLGISKAYARRYLGELSADGLISVVRQPGKANVYFLAYEGSPKDHPSDHPSSRPVSLAGNSLQSDCEVGIKKKGSPQDHPSDHPKNVDTASDTAKGDPRSGKNSEKIPSPEISEDKGGVKDHLWLKPLPGNNPGGDPGGDPGVVVCENIHDSQTDVKGLTAKESGGFPQGDPGGDPLPLLQAKASYWSLSLKREVKVFQIFDALSEVSCQAPGRGTVGLPFTDLQCLSQSPRSDFSVGDKVIILEGKHKETFATITTIRADGIWVKSDDRKKSLARAFFPHQLVKA